MLLVLSLFGCGEKTVKVYSSASEIKGDEFSYVETKLKEQGFTNIELKEQKDISVDWLYKDGEVAEVIIGYSTDYDEKTKMFLQ